MQTEVQLPIKKSKIQFGYSFRFTLPFFISNSSARNTLLPLVGFHFRAFARLRSRFFHFSSLIILLVTAPQGCRVFFP